MSKQRINDQSCLKGASAAAGTTAAQPSAAVPLGLIGVKQPSCAQSCPTGVKAAVSEQLYCCQSCLSGRGAAAGAAAPQPPGAVPRGLKGILTAFLTGPLVRSSQACPANPAVVNGLVHPSRPSWTGWRDGSLSATPVGAGAEAPQPPGAVPRGPTGLKQHSFAQSCLEETSPGAGAAAPQSPGAVPWGLPGPHAPHAGHGVPGRGGPAGRPQQRAAQGRPHLVQVSTRREQGFRCLRRALGAEMPWNCEVRGALSSKQLKGGLTWYRSAAAHTGWPGCRGKLHHRSQWKMATQWPAGRSQQRAAQGQPRLVQVSTHAQLGMGMWASELGVNGCRPQVLSRPFSAHSQGMGHACTQRLSSSTWRASISILAWIPTARSARSHRHITAQAAACLHTEAPQVQVTWAACGGNSRSRWLWGHAVVWTSRCFMQLVLSVSMFGPLVSLSSLTPSARGCRPLCWIDMTPITQSWKPCRYLPLFINLHFYSANASRKGRKLAMDITDGLAWLHMHKIIHSDLKTQVGCLSLVFKQGASLRPGRGSMLPKAGPPHVYHQSWIVGPSSAVPPAYVESRCTERQTLGLPLQACNGNSTKLVGHQAAPVYVLLSSWLPFTRWNQQVCRAAECAAHRGPRHCQDRGRGPEQGAAHHLHRECQQQCGHLHLRCSGSHPRGEVRPQGARLTPFPVEPSTPHSAASSCALQAVDSAACLRR